MKAAAAMQRAIRVNPNCAVTKKIFVPRDDASNMPPCETHPIMRAAVSRVLALAGVAPLLDTAVRWRMEVEYRISPIIVRAKMHSVSMRYNACHMT